MPLPAAEPAPAAERNRFAQQLFTPLPARYDRLAEVLSFGQNGRWRRAMISRAAPAEEDTVLDVASGTAGVALQIAARTGARVVGLDLTEQMLRQGQRNVAGSAVSERIDLVAGRAEQLPFADATFDALTFTYLLRYVLDPQATLRELARVVKPGGRVASLEFLLPPSRFWRAWWWLYTRLLLPAGGRPEHLPALPSLPGLLDRRGVARGGILRCRRPGHEPGRRACHVGNARTWLTGSPPATRNRGRPRQDSSPRPAPGPPSTPRARADGVTGGRCCTPRTPHGTCPTW